MTDIDLKTSFRNAMCRLGAAVNIVTTDGEAGRAGFAATAVCSVSDTPPMLLVCLNRTSSAYQAVRTNGVLCVNVVSSDHRQLCGLFGGKTPVAERFAGGTWKNMKTGAPALEGAIVSFDCRIKSVSDGGTHDILLCDIEDILDASTGDALIYFERDYHAVKSQPKVLPGVN